MLAEMKSTDELKMLATVTGRETCRPAKFRIVNAEGPLTSRLICAAWGLALLHRCRETTDRNPRRVGYRSVHTDDTKPNTIGWCAITGASTLVAETISEIEN